MAFKLDKGDLARRAELVDDLRELWGKVEDAVSVYNAEVAKLKEPLEKAIADYNEKSLEAAGFAEDIGNAADGEIDDKSEKWREGEKGEAAIEWKDAWQGVEIGELEMDWPDEISVEAPDDADNLEQLPAEAGAAE
jgi:hypothetical protein